MLSPSSGNTVIKSKLIGRRMFLLTAAKAIVTFGIIGRLVSLQINERTKYKTLSDKNRFREWKLAPERGAIKDFFNTKIASSLPKISIMHYSFSENNIAEIYWFWVFGLLVNIPVTGPVKQVDTAPK